MPWGRGPGWVTRVPRVRNWDPPMRTRPERPPLSGYTRAVKAELDMSAAVTLNGSGAGYVTLAPDGMTVWVIHQWHVSTGTGPTDHSAAFGYRGAVLPHRQLFETAQGGGDSGNFAARLRPGDTLVVVWSGGIAGDVATLNITGDLHAMMMP